MAGQVTVDENTLLFTLFPALLDNAALLRGVCRAF